MWKVVKPGTFFVLAVAAAFAQPQPQRGVRVSEPITVQRKIALVIGNQAYPQSPLRNALNDASAMAQELRDLKFDEVTERHDLTIRQMRAEIDGLTLKLRPGDLVMFYYAGHGVQANEQNYLIPIDFTGTEADLPYEAYSAAQLRDKLEQTGARLRILVLDACRNNPFRSARSSSRGLSPMGSAVEGTYIAYATADNGVADDNPNDKNGLFTKELLASMRKPGLDLKQVFEQTKEDVYQISKRQQRPFTYDGVIGEFFFTEPPPPPPAPPPVAAPAVGPEADLLFWKSIDQKDPDQLRLYLAQFPKGQFAALANLNLKRFSAPPPSAPPTVNPAPPSSPAGNAGNNSAANRGTPPASSPSGAAAVVPPAPTTTLPKGGPFKPGDRDLKKDGQYYVLIPSGTFRMGCSQGDPECENDERPVHTVTIGKNFWIGQTPVTVAGFHLYRAETKLHDQMDRNLNGATNDDTMPIVNITWDESREYCEWAGGRLPTEAEWEYAARATTVSARYGPLEDVAWYGNNSGNARIDASALWLTDQDAYPKKLFDNGNGPRPVAKKKPNAWHLYDMLGDVWQWVSDYYGKDYYATQAMTDPTGPQHTPTRGMRGGSWFAFSSNVRVSARGHNTPDHRGNTVGFRCVIPNQE